jgi:hypothetical protein
MLIDFAAAPKNNLTSNKLIFILFVILNQFDFNFTIHPRSARYRFSVLS